jgi:acetoin utilization deacetylase AcuC-like enzyme
LDSDTRLSGGTWAAARAACGAALAAVDLVMADFEPGGRQRAPLGAVAPAAAAASSLASSLAAVALAAPSSSSSLPSSAAAAAASAAAEEEAEAAAEAEAEAAAGSGAVARRAFVCARPPGHHAGPRGAVPNPRHFWRSPEMCSCGFCVFNNAAVAAAFARNK